MALPQDLPALSPELKMKNKQTSASFFAEVTELQAIENVFAGVEQSQMILAATNYPTANLTRKIADMRERLGKSFADKADAEEVEISLLDDLESWRTSLLERDQAFTAFDLRSYCTNVYPPFDNSVYADLAGFYRLLPPSAAILSKFDFVITQFFSRQLDNNRRAVKFESKKIVDELSHLNVKWTGSELDTKSFKSQIHKSLLTLSKLSARAKSHKTLKSWMESEFFDYSREIKRGLSETFFVPEVTTGIIICNLVVGNHFVSLCETDSAVRSEISVASGGVDATKNSTPSKPTSQTFIYSSLDDDFAEAMEQERLSNFHGSTGATPSNEIFLTRPESSNEKSSNNDDVVLTSSAEFSSTAGNTDRSAVFGDSPALQKHEILDSEKYSAVLSNNSNKATLVCELALNVENADQTTKKAGITDQTTNKTDNTNLRIGNVLAQLSNVRPNRELIKEYVQQSVTAQIRNLNIDEFLDAELSSENRNITEALRLILRAEEATRVVTSAERGLSRKFQDEVARLVEEIQAAGNILRRSMSETVSAREEDAPPQKYFEASLYATKTLVESQLRLNSAIIHLQSKEEIRLSLKNKTNKPNNPSPEESIVDDSVRETTLQTKSQVEFKFKSAPNKWLLIAGLAVLLLGASWFALYPKNSATSAASANVQSLDPKLMIGGANLIKVRVSKNTLYGFVNNEWSGQTQQQKKDNLRSLLEEGTKYGYKNVLLIGQNGELVGNATETEINLR